jgi:hypothetical protein
MTLFASDPDILTFVIFHLHLSLGFTPCRHPPLQGTSSRVIIKYGEVHNKKFDERLEVNDKPCLSLRDAECSSFAVRGRGGVCQRP